MKYFTWFEKYGYESDPLTIKPMTKLVARDGEIEAILENLVSGNIVLLQAEVGLGKTSILKAVEDRFSRAKDYNVCYFSLVNGFESIKEIFSREGFIESLLIKIGLKRKRKNIVLIDEGQLILFNQAENLRNLFDCDYIHSLVLSSSEKNNLNLSTGFKGRIGENLRLPKLTNEELKQLLEMRLHGLNPLHLETVDYLAKISDGNPRQFLINCKKVCIKVHEFFHHQGSIKLDEAKNIVVKKYNNNLPEKNQVLEEKNILHNLTPLQKAILQQLNENEMSLSELSKATGSSVGTIGKQISVLSLKAKKEYMARKGVKTALITKDKNNAITIYSLTEYAKKILNKGE